MTTYSKKDVATAIRLLHACAMNHDLHDDVYSAASCLGITTNRGPRLAIDAWCEAGPRGLDEGDRNKDEHDEDGQRDGEAEAMLRCGWLPANSRLRR